jgi:periplasmic protein TonB
MLSLMLLMAASAADGPTGAAPARSVDGGRNWIYTSDYPADALRNRRGGVTTVRLNVSREGEVDGCAIATSSGHADLDAVSCMAMVMRGRYEPARNWDGQRVASVVLRQIVWDPRAANLDR